MYHIERGFNANTLKPKCAAAIGWINPVTRVSDGMGGRLNLIL